MRRLAPHLLFLALTFLLGPSLFLNFGEAPVTDTVADPATTQWNFWWVGRVLSAWCGGDPIPEGDGLFHTSMLFYPVGTSLAWHTLDLTWAVLLWPLQPMVGILGQHAIALILCTYLTAWGTWLCARKIGCSPLAATLATIAITLHGYRLAEGHHFNLFNTFFFLFAFWLLARLRDPEPRFGSAICLGLVAWGVLFASQFHTLGCALLALGFAIAVFVIDDSAGRWRFFRRALVALLVVLPALVIQFLVLRGAPAPIAYGPEAQARTAADLWQFLISPHLRVPMTNTDETTIWRGLFRAQTWYLPGYLLAAAFLWGAFRSHSRRRLLLLGAGSIFFYTLSLGPWLKVGDPRTINPDPTGIPLPGLLLQWVPALGTVRSVWHFGFLGTMLAALGGALSMDQLLDRLGIRQRLATVALLPIAVLADSYMGSIITIPDRLRGSADVIRGKDEPGAVIAFPHLFYELRGMFMYQQTIHQRPIVVGYIARDPEDFTEWKVDRLWPVELEDVGIDRRPRLSLRGELNLREDIARHDLGWLLVDLGWAGEKSYRERVAAEFHRLGYREQEIIEEKALLVRLATQPVEEPRAAAPPTSGDRDAATANPTEASRGESLETTPAPQSAPAR